MYRRLWITLSLTLVLVVVLDGQALIVNGTIKDAETGEALFAPKIAGYEDFAKNLDPLECFILDIPGEPQEEECVVWTGGDPGSGPPRTGGSGNCRGEDEWGMRIIMRGIYMSNVSSFETFGNPELRLHVFGGITDNFLVDPTGGLVADGLYTPKRRDVNREWTNENDRLEYWNEAYGDQLTFRWEEEDNGRIGNLDIDFQVTYAGQNFGVDATFESRKNSDYIGRTKVYRRECEREFNVGSALRFRLSY